MCFSVTQATAGFEPIIFLVDASNIQYYSSNIISDDSVLLPEVMTM